MRITIRRAHHNDLDFLLAQLREFSQFFGTEKALFGDESYARQTLLGMIADHPFFVAEGEGAGPVGFVAGLITPHLFNPNIRVLAETFWWVSEEHRGSRAGLMLLEEFVKFGKENVDWITFALEEKSPVNEKALTKRGFKLQERSYLKEII